MLRTRKSFGAERWKLRYVVEALPTLILVSLGLFFVAMTDYVWTLNEEVAILITAFSGASTLLYLLMLLAAALFPDCPFQTAPSAALVYLSHPILRTVILSLRNIFALAVLASAKLANSFVNRFPRIYSSFWNVYWAAERWKRKMWTPARQLWLQRAKPSESRKRLDALHAASARSMLSLSPRDDVMISVAHNVPAIQDLKSVQQITGTETTLSLAWLLQSLLLDARAGRPAAEDKGLVVARGLAHLLLADPNQSTPEVPLLIWRFLPPEIWPALTSSDLKLSLIYILALGMVVTDPRSSTVAGIRTKVPLSDLTDQVFRQPGQLSNSTVEQYLHHYLVLGLLIRREATESLQVAVKSFRVILSSDSISSTKGLARLAAGALSAIVGTGMINLYEPVPSGDSRVQRAWTMRFR